MIQFECKEIPNINRLDDYIGKSIGYKAITELLEIKYHKGDGKTKQLNIIQQYYEIEKIKTKYKILCKYEKIIPIEDNRKSIYYDDLETIILFALHNNKTSYDTWSISRALLIATLTNKNYNLGRKDISLTAGALEVDENYLYDFYNISFSRMKRIFESALNRMSNKKLIQYNTCIIICRHITKIDCNKFGEPIIDENKRIQYKVTEVYQEATKEDRESILEAENKVLHDMGLSTIQDVVIRRKYDIFKRKVNRILRKEANILFYYDAYSIVKYNTGIAAEIHEMKEIMSRISLNKLKIDSFTDSNDKKLNSNLDDKEILIDYLIDNKCKLQLNDLINTYQENIKQLQHESDYIDNIPF